MNKEKYIIEGHYNLELIPGNLYDIHYGIHQGVYEYLGKETEGFWEDAYTFKNIETGEIFCHYASLPYEFTRNVTKSLKI